MSEQDTLYNVMRDGMQHMTVYGYELKDTDVILGTAHTTVTINLDEIEQGTELKPGEHIRVDNSENVTLERDTSKQLSNGICHTKSEKTPEMTRQDGVLNISDVQDTTGSAGCCASRSTTAMSEPLIVKNADSYDLDTREQLEADVHQYANPSGYKNTLGASWEKKMLSFLDRQAAITRRECWHDCCQNHVDYDEEYKPAIDELTAEVEQLKRANRIQAESFRKLEANYARVCLDLAKAKGGTR